MKYDKQGIKRRRKKLLTRRVHVINETDARSDQPYHGKQNLFTTRGSRRYLRWQVMISLLLLLLVSGLFRLNQEWVSPIKEFAHKVMERDYNFAGTAYWMKERLGQFPALIPTFTLKKEESHPVFSPPLEGTVVAAFASTHTGVIIETGIKSEVHPIGTGWVRFVGKNKGTGNTVMIQHADGKESIYGFLGEIYVRKNDWVYPETKIGLVDEQSLFLQIKDNSQYLDPLDVISFD